MPERTVPGQSGSKKRPPNGERRAWVRYSCDTDIAFQPLGDRKTGGWHPARVGNISAKGVALLLDTSIERGSILSVKLEGTAQRFSRPLLVRVVRVVERPAGVWHIGCTFAIPLGEQELATLLRTDKAAQPPADKKKEDSREESKPEAVAHDPFLRGSASERRFCHRRRTAVSVIVSYGSAFEKNHEALATDASIGGLRLLTGQPFGRGTVLRVRSAKASHRVPSLDVRVKSCRPQQTMWVIGTQFVQPPPSEVMLYFG